MFDESKNELWKSKFLIGLFEILKTFIVSVVRNGLRNGLCNGLRKGLRNGQRNGLRNGLRNELRNGRNQKGPSIFV